MTLPPKKTLLYEWHKDNNSNMGVFGGYEMPLWYPQGAKKEHLAVVTRVGVFDTSHMAVVMVKGPDAFDLLQHCFSRDLASCVDKGKSPISSGHCVYGVFLNHDGGVIDDAIVYQLAEDNFMVVVNAAMGGKIARHLKNEKSGKIIVVKDLTDKVGKIDLQGPLSAKVLMKLLADPTKIMTNLLYFSFKGHFDQNEQAGENVILQDGGPSILLSRTGYTGEMGFEIFIDQSAILGLWEKILKIGKDYGILPCGLAARDSLRVGAMLPLSHQDIGSWPFINNPWSFALPFNKNRSGFTKSFIGGDSLLSTGNPGFTYPFAGFDLRKIDPDQSEVFLSSGNPIGKVLTCVTESAIGRHNDIIYSIASPDKPDGFNPKGLCCGFLKVNRPLDEGEILEIRDRRRKLKVMVAGDIRPDRTARQSIQK